MKGLVGESGQLFISPCPYVFFFFKPGMPGAGNESQGNFTEGWFLLVPGFR